MTNDAVMIATVTFQRRILEVLSALVVGTTLLTANIGHSSGPNLKLSVGNPGLQHFDSDGGVELDFGLTDENGNAVGALRPDNLQVFEDGKPAKILDFRGTGQGRPVDIVFVLDVTESMQPYIDAVKASMKRFAQDLAANNRDYRLGLVTFEDYVISKYPDCNCPYRNRMTSNEHEFEDWVGSLHAGGGGDIPEDQLDALAYASSFAFRPDAEAILILITDAPPHYAGDGSGHTQHDRAFWDHHPQNTDVTDLVPDKVSAMLKRNSITLYAVVPPPFIAPQYQQIIDETHGRSYNIVTHEGRFSELVGELGHSIATEYSLTYRTPRPIEDGTSRSVELKVTYSGANAAAQTSYTVRGVGGAAINVPSESGGPATSESGGTGLLQLSFQWWNGVVPLIALLGLLALSRAHFGVPTEELKAIVEAQSEPAPRYSEPARRPPGPAPVPQAAARPNTRGARLLTVEPLDPVPAEYSLLKDEISIGRGENNDVVIPHASVSRVHARLTRRDGAYELVDLNSTNGSFVNEQPVHAPTVVSSGCELRLGDVRFRLQI